MRLVVLKKPADALTIASVSVIGLLGFFSCSAPAATISDNLQGYWAFDDDLLDGTTNNRDGTFNGGSAVFSSDIPLGSGKSLSLDGTDDYVEIDGGTGGSAYVGVTGTGPRTSAAWICRLTRVTVRGLAELVVFQL